MKKKTSRRQEARISRHAIRRTNVMSSPGAFAPRTPLHAHSLAASPARSVCVAHSLRSFASVRHGLSPLGLPYTRTRSPLRRLAPFAWLTRSARSHQFATGFRPSDSPTRALARRFAGSLRLRGSLAPLVRISSPRAFAPRTPLHAHSLAASPARSVCVAHSLRSFASVRHRLSPLRLPHTRPPSPPPPLPPFAWPPRSARSHHFATGFRPSDSPTLALARRFPP